MDAATEDELDDDRAVRRTVISAEKLARLLGVPPSVLSFLEARVPQVRSLSEGGRRVFRAEDAVLVAGLTELLYAEGLTLRDVYGMMRSNERERIAERGRRVLAGALSVPSSPSAPRRPIPPDALVAPRGAAEREAPRPARQSAEIAQILGELNDCVRVLDEAR